MTIQQMAIGSAEQFVFWYQRATFGKALQCADLLLQSHDKGCCRIRLVLSDVLPNFDDILLGRLCDFNLEFSWHA